MAQDQGTGNGEAAAPAGAPQWLMDLRARSALMRKRRERPAGLCFGRWLGDFLDQDTPSGLLHAEEKLLFAAANGGALRAPKPRGPALGRVRRLAQAAQHEGGAGAAFRTPASRRL